VNSRDLPEGLQAIKGDLQYCISNLPKQSYINFNKRMEEKMSLKNKLAQVSLLVALFVGAVAAVPLSDSKLISGGTGIAPMGECSGGVGCTT
jgi:hypothetical protein